MVQFRCPQCGNVLQADPGQAGQHSQCPICQALFIIPAPVVTGMGPSPPLPGSSPLPAGREPAGREPAGKGPAGKGPAGKGPAGKGPAGKGPAGKGPAGKGPAGGEPATLGPTFWSPSEPRAATPPPASPSPAVLELQEAQTLHIPCPQCREILEAPVEMLDQEVLCPHCEAQFRLERRNSVEFQRQRQQQLEIRERQAGKFWFNWAIVAVVLVVIFLLFLIFSSRG